MFCRLWSAISASKTNSFKSTLTMIQTFWKTTLFHIFSAENQSKNFSFELKLVLSCPSFKNKLFKTIKMDPKISAFEHTRQSEKNWNSIFQALFFSKVYCVYSCLRPPLRGGLLAAMDDWCNNIADGDPFPSGDPLLLSGQSEMPNLPLSRCIICTQI